MQGSARLRAVLPLWSQQGGQRAECSRCQPQYVAVAPQGAARAPCLAAQLTCCPKPSAAGIPGASVPGMRRLIFLQNWRMSLHDVSRSLRRMARSDASCPAWGAAKGPQKDRPRAGGNPAAGSRAGHSYLQEGSQPAHLHAHAVQGTLRELRSTSTGTVSSGQQTPGRAAAPGQAGALVSGISGRALSTPRCHGSRFPRRSLRH